jgi:aromatic ring-cleaving dioxygenase
MRPGILARILHIKPSPLRKGPNGTFIFIHITKTAGTSIGNAIGLPVKHHLTAKEVIAKIGKQKWNTAYKFTFVRNPWDKVVSLYEYRRKKDKTKIASRNIPFTEWVKLTLGPHSDPFYYNNVKSFQPQVEWLKDAEGNIDIDFIGKFESIHADFEQIKLAIGTSAELPHLNATSRSNYRDYYTDETRQIIAAWYKEDIEAFGYTFD